MVGGRDAYYGDVCQIFDNIFFPGWGNEDGSLMEVYYTNPLKCRGAVVEVGTGDGYHLLRAIDRTAPIHVGSGERRQWRPQRRRTLPVGMGRGDADRLHQFPKFVQGGHAHGGGCHGDTYAGDLLAVISQMAW